MLVFGSSWWALVDRFFVHHGMLGVAQCDIAT
jgi:hypothetical protein